MWQDENLKDKFRISDYFLKDKLNKIIQGFLTKNYFSDDSSMYSLIWNTLVNDFSKIVNKYYTGGR